MKVHFVRHAQAVERSAGLPDEHRNLSCRGRKRFRGIADCLKKTGIDPDLIITSPKIRAVQTAEILAETLRFNGELRISPSLSTGPDFADLDALLRADQEAGEIVIIGHEPALGEVIAKLLQLSVPCVLSKGCVVSMKISLKRSIPYAELTGLITGSGKRINKPDAAMERLLGKKHPVKEEVAA